MNEVPSQFRALDASAKADNIKVIIFHALFRGKVVLDQAGANAFYLVGADRGADTAAANGEAAIYFSGSHGLPQWNDKIRVIIVWIQLVGPKVHDLVAFGLQPRDEFLFQLKPAVIRGNSEVH